MAAAVIAAAAERKSKLSQPEDVTSVPGKGILGVVNGRKLPSAAPHSWSRSEPCKKPLSAREPHPAPRPLCRHRWQVCRNHFVGDLPKSSTPDALRGIKAHGIRVVMLTGDNRFAAADIAKKLDIEEFEAEVLPEGKLEIIRKLQGQGRVVAMAGDGINDAPALAQADVGIAMGTGTDVAMESGGITLVKGDLTGILRARKLSQATMRNIRQNLFFAFIYNALGVPIAAGVLYPFFGVLLSPIFAAAAMSFSSVSVITNALRLRSVKL